MDFARDLYLAFLSAEVLLAPEYLVITLIFAYALWIWRRPGAGFWAWALPRAIWRHRSTRLDLQLFVIGRVLVWVGALTRLALTPIIALWLAGVLAPAGGPALLGPWAQALVLFLVWDLTLYALHRLFHRSALIWPLHAVHHAAEVMTPVTAYRHHPLAVLLGALAVALTAGVAQGVAIAIAAPDTTAAQIAGINALFVLSAFLLANFRHSHIHIGFGRWFERVFISPAQHQIHHSIDPTHHGRNFGEVLALWDWAFGTLALSRRNQSLTFGLTDNAERALRSHTLGAALISPLRRMRAHIRGGRN